MTASFIFYQEGKEPRHHELADKITLGRAGRIKIASPGDNRFSRLHATVSLIGGSWYIFDGNGETPSLNGVFVNKAWHKISEPTKLKEGDHIYFFPGINRDRYCVFVEDSGDETIATKTVWEMLGIWWARQRRRLGRVIQAYRWLMLIVPFLIGLVTAEWGHLKTALLRLLEALSTGD
ncbi:MAG: FHA domain-containing protein [Cyanobacteria bacterium J06635_1]